MKKNIHVLMVIFLLSLFNSCKKDDPSKDNYYKGNWKLEKIETNVSGGPRVEQVINKGEIKFKGRRKNAKRGSYDVSYNLTYFNQQEQKIVTESISDKGDFVWRVVTFNSTQYEDFVALSLDSFEDRLFGVGGDGVGAVGGEIIDDNTIAFNIGGLGKYSNLRFRYTFSR